MFVLWHQKYTLIVRGTELQRGSLNSLGGGRTFYSCSGFIGFSG